MKNLLYSQIKSLAQEAGVEICFADKVGDSKCILIKLGGLSDQNLKSSIGYNGVSKGMRNAHILSKLFVGCGYVFRLLICFGSAET